MAREYAREEESKLCLILDTLIPEPAPTGCTGQFEKAVSLAASLAGHFCEEGAEVEFLSGLEYIPRGMGMDHLYRILKSLAVVECRVVSEREAVDLRGELSGLVEPVLLEEILSHKVFKVILTPRPKGSFPAAIWRSSHVVYFDEL